VKIDPDRTVSAALRVEASVITCSGHTSTPTRRLRRWAGSLRASWAPAPKASRLITAAFDEDVGVGRILVNDASCPRRAGQQAPPRLGWPLRAPGRPRS